MRNFLLTLSLIFVGFSASAIRAPVPAYPKIVDETAMKDVDPCADFYQFACGGFLDATVIPNDRSSVSRQVTPMDEAVDVNLNAILEGFKKGDLSSPATNEEKLGAFYASCMSVDQNSKYNEDLALQFLPKIRKGLATRDSLAHLTAKMHKLGAGVFFGFGSAQDPNDSTRVIGDVAQFGMALPTVTYYLSKDPKFVKIREQYKAHVAKIFELTGVSEGRAKAIAASVLDMESFLAKKAYTPEEYGDPKKTNNPLGLSGLKKLAPEFNWDIYFQDLNVTTQAINVDEPEFFARINTFLQTYNREDLENYLSWIWLHRTASDIGGDFEKEDFAFWHTTMSGAKAMLPRWKHCTQEISGKMSYALAEAYLKTFDGTAIKAKTEEMITQIKAAFVDDLQSLNSGTDAWLDTATYQKALDKIGLIGQKVGAPEKFRDYTNLKVNASYYLENSLNDSAFGLARDLAKIGKPVDKTEWSMMPWEVNAYYDPPNNEFVFPYGILMPPSLDLTASDGANFGAFGGGTIGHELTHGFDNAGSQYDGHGNLVNWWTEDTRKQFDTRSQCYVNQADKYQIAEAGMNVKGQQTLPENLADQGGVKLGYKALEKILSTRAEGPLWMGRYSERQQYWIAYAQSWCTKYTQESLRRLITTNEHPPAEFRVNQVLRNRPEFARDFSCKAGAAMAPANRCSLW